jgi:hypothetical protein
MEPLRSNLNTPDVIPVAGSPANRRHRGPLILISA